MVVRGSCPRGGRSHVAGRHCWLGRLFGYIIERAMKSLYITEGNAQCSPLFVSDVAQNIDANIVFSQQPCVFTQIGTLRHAVARFLYRSTVARPKVWHGVCQCRNHTAFTWKYRYGAAAGRHHCARSSRRKMFPLTQ